MLIQWQHQIWAKRIRHHLQVRNTVHSDTGTEPWQNRSTEQKFPYYHTSLNNTVTELKEIFHSGIEED